MARVLIFFSLHVGYILGFLPPTSNMWPTPINLIMHFTHGTYRWVMPHYKYSFLYSCTQGFPEGLKNKWLIWLAFPSGGTATDLARFFFIVLSRWELLPHSLWNFMQVQSHLCAALWQTPCQTWFFFFLALKLNTVICKITKYLNCLTYG